MNSKSKNKYHYVYRITNLVEDKHYYGKRSSILHPKLDLGKKYFSSSRDKSFKKEQLEYPNRFKYKIIYILSSAKDAIYFESKLHKRFDVGNNLNFYNRCKQHLNGWDTTGMLTVKDNDGNIFMVSVNDPRYLSGELVAIAKQKILCKDTNGNTFQVSNNDSRYLSGELVGINKNKVLVKDTNGNTLMVSKNDMRYLNGELVGITTGHIIVKDKDENTLMVSTKDPRYLSGELVSISKGKVNVKDNNGNIYQVSVNDPRYLNGELNSIHKGRKLSEEHKMNIGKSGIGRKHSEESKLKISLAKKGHIKSEESKLKMSLAKQGIPTNKVWVHNIELQKCILIDKNEPIPNGYIIGRIYNRKNKKQK